RRARVKADPRESAAGIAVGQAEAKEGGRKGIRKSVRIGVIEVVIRQSKGNGHVPAPIGEREGRETVGKTTAEQRRREGPRVGIRGGKAETGLGSIGCVLEETKLRSARGRGRARSTIDVSELGQVIRVGKSVDIARVDYDIGSGCRGN